MKRNWTIIALMLLALPMMAQNRQAQVIDKVVAVVGKNIILQSDIENQYIQYRLQASWKTCCSKSSCSTRPKWIVSP